MRRILNLLRELGIDPLRMYTSVKNLPKFTVHMFRFWTMKGAGKKTWSPILRDFDESAGSADGHYFWQDLICANWINVDNPEKHFDVGSRIDGFIAHLLSFRTVTQLDIRPMKVRIPNLEIVLGDAQKDLSRFKSSFDSVSSLHSIEHFGLGRYNDELDSKGHEKGLKNIASCVKTGGTLYISFPIGSAKVEFNAQRIIDPEWPITLLNDFDLIEFVLIPWKGEPTYGLSPSQVSKQTWGQAGLYRFKKKNT